MSFWWGNICDNKKNVFAFLIPMQRATTRQQQQQQQQQKKWNENSFHQKVHTWDSLEDNQHTPKLTVDGGEGGKERGRSWGWEKMYMSEIAEAKRQSINIGIYCVWKHFSLTHPLSLSPFHSALVSENCLVEVYEQHASRIFAVWKTRFLLVALRPKSFLMESSLSCVWEWSL